MKKKTKVNKKYRISSTHHKQKYLNFIKSLEEGSGEWSTVPQIIRFTFKTIINDILQDQQKEIQKLSDKVRLLEVSLSNKPNSDDILSILNSRFTNSSDKEKKTFLEYNKILQKIINKNSSQLSKFESEIRKLEELFKKRNEYICVSDFEKYSLNLQGEIKKKLDNNFTHLNNEVRDFKEKYSNELKTSLNNLYKLRKQISKFIIERGKVSLDKTN